MKARDTDGNSAQLAMEKGHKSLSNMLTNQLVTLKGLTCGRKGDGGVLFSQIGPTLMFINLTVVGPLGRPSGRRLPRPWMVVISSVTGLIFFGAG